MPLAEAMDQLADAIRQLPTDLTIEANVTTKLHDDVPPMFVEYNTACRAGCYQRVIETSDGIVSKSIILVIHD